jgi:hypothetical protein
MYQVYETFVIEKNSEENHFSKPTYRTVGKEERADIISKRGHRNYCTVTAPLPRDPHHQQVLLLLVHSRSSRLAYFGPQARKIHRYEEGMISHYSDRLPSCKTKNMKLDYRYRYDTVEWEVASQVSVCGR